MNWDEKPLEAGSRLRHRQETIHDAATRAAYLEGWLDAGSEIRSDEAVERAAKAMHADDLAHDHCAHEWGEFPVADQWYLRNARAAVNALLGEDT